MNIVGGYAVELESKKVGLLISAMDTSENIRFYQGVCDRSVEYGYSVYSTVICPRYEVLDSYHNGELYHIGNMNFGALDGLIVSINTIARSGVKEAIFEIVKDYNIPIFAIDCDIEGAYKINESNYIAMRQVVEHLINKHNKKKINYISGPYSNSECSDRLRAYVDVMTENDLYDPARIYEGHLYVADGVESLRYFESNEIAADYDAVVCANDYGAISLAEELKKKGKMIPEDIAITGFDDREETVKYSPMFTTVTRDEYSIGASTVDLMHKVWIGEDVEAVTYFESIPVFRESCGCTVEAEKITEINAKQFMYFSEGKMFEIFIKQCIDTCMDANDFDGWLAGLKKFLYQCDPKEFYICVNDNYTEAFDLEKYEVFESPFFNKTVDRYRLVLRYRKGEEKSDGFGVNLFSTSIDESVDICNCIPIHQRGKNFGFVVFKNSIFPLMESSFWNWKNGICNSLGNLNDRMLLKSAVEELNELYMRDSLTGLYNRFGMDSFLANRANDIYNSSVLFLFGDVNGLKKINDNYGHEEGDYAITTIALAIKRIRNKDIAAVRYGGDEFIVIGIGLGEKESAELKERIYKELHRLNGMKDKPFDLSISFGECIKNAGEAKDLQELIKLADERMYENKMKTRMGQM